MKRIKVLVVLAAALAMAGFAIPVHAGGEYLLHISFMSGNVQVKTEDTGDWVSASVNMPLRVGDRLWVPDGARMELMMSNGTTLRLDQLSALDVDALDVDQSVFYLEMGRLYANFRGTQGNSLRVDTPDSSVHANIRAIFRLDLPDGSDFNDVAVMKGSLTVESKQEIKRVDEGEQYSLRNGKYPELASVSPPDEWERWNRSRDEIYATNQSARYLPEELQPYGPGLDPYGGWVYVPVYGYCWHPRVAVSVGWAPYHNGRWCWMGGNYVWISYDPWGYVPHHYGRWHYAGFIGWVWVPPMAAAVHWGPGYVGWAVNGNHVAWVPLGPRDSYYGNHGYPGGNVAGTWATRNVQVNKTVYQNITVKNAVTMVHIDTFIRGKRVNVQTRENPFLHQKVVARPDFQPERTTRMPVIKVVAQHEKPPAHLRASSRLTEGREGLNGLPSRENQNREAVISNSGDESTGKLHNPSQSTLSMKKEGQRVLSGEPIKREDNPANPERKSQSRASSKKLGKIDDPARRNFAQSEDIRGANETVRRYTNEDLTRYETVRAPAMPAEERSPESIASPSPSGDKSLRVKPVATKRESIAAPPERKRHQSIGGNPVKDQQRFDRQQDASIQIPNSGRERPIREMANPGEMHRAQREFQKADRPAREMTRETKQAMQPEREGRTAESKSRPAVAAKKDGDGQAASRSYSTSASDTVKSFTPSSAATSMGGQHGGSTGRFGLR